MAVEVYQPQNRDTKEIWFKQKRYMASPYSPFSGDIVPSSKNSEQESPQQIEVKTGEMVFTQLTDEQSLVTNNLITCHSLAVAAINDEQSEVFGLAHLSTLSKADTEKAIEASLQTLPQGYDIYDMSLNIREDNFNNLFLTSFNQVLEKLSKNNPSFQPNQRIHLRGNSETGSSLVTRNHFSHTTYNDNGEQSMYQAPWERPVLTTRS